MTHEIPGKLLRLRESYRKKLPTYAEEIRARWARVSEYGQEIVTPDMDALIRLSHRLSGSGEAYGFVGVSKAARAVEKACRSESIEEIRLCDLKAPIDELLSVLELASVSHFSDKPESTANNDQPERLLGAPVRKVLLVDDDTDFMAHMTAVLEWEGFAVVTLDAIEKFSETVASCAPLAAVVDMDFVGARYAGAQQVMAPPSRYFCFRS